MLIIERQFYQRRQFYHCPRITCLALDLVPKMQEWDKGRPGNLLLPKLVTKFPLQKQSSLWSLKINFWKMDFWNWCKNDEPITKQLQRLWYQQQALLSDAWCSVKLWYFFINCIDNRLYNIVHQVITFVKFYDIFHNAKICQHIFRDFYSSIIQ